MKPTSSFLITTNSSFFKVESISCDITDMNMLKELNVFRGTAYHILTFPKSPNEAAM